MRLWRNAPTRWARSPARSHALRVVAADASVLRRFVRAYSTLRRGAGSDCGQHNARFAVQPQHPQDLHRPWTGSAVALADVCALHHQRQLSAQGACKFEGRILQVLPGQAHAPKARAMVDIAQHADGTLRLSYRGHPLAHRSYAFGHAVPNRQATDHKTLNAKVDKVRDAHRNKLLRLAAELAFQDSQRKAGIYKPDTPAIVPRAGAGRYGLRPSQPAPAPS